MSIYFVFRKQFLKFATNKQERLYPNKKKDEEIDIYPAIKDYHDLRDRPTTPRRHSRQQDSKKHKKSRYEITIFAGETDIPDKKVNLHKKQIRHMKKVKITVLKTMLNEELTKKMASANSKHAR